METETTKVQLHRMAKQQRGRLRTGERRRAEDLRVMFNEQEKSEIVAAADSVGMATTFLKLAMFGDS